MLQDLRFTVRLMARERWFFAVAILVLALGIGANATVFTLVQAALLKGLPFPDSGRLAVVSFDGKSGRLSNVSHAELQDWRAQSRTFSGLAAFRQDQANVSDDRAMPEQVRAAWLTANAFTVLAQVPELGRDFALGEDRPGAEPVVLIGHRLWKNRYGGDRGVIGRPIRLNGMPATIVGVMPDHVRFPINAELWAPFVPSEAQRARDARALVAFGRLRDDTTFAEARAEMAGIAQWLAAAFPETNRDLVGARVETFTDRFVGGAARPMFLAMMGAVSFVLLIACANVANLLLSRSAHRAREVALRMALGATRRRVLKQLLVESLVLGVIGGAIGLGIALAAVPIFDASIQDPAKPFWIVFAVDLRVVAYVAGVCVTTAIIVGLAPALHVSRGNLNDVLNEGGRANAMAPRARRFSSAMVVMQLALTAVLLVGAGLLMRSFANAATLDVGMETDGMMAMGLQLPQSRYETPEARYAFFERLELRLAAVAGVQGAAVTTSLPLSGISWTPFEIEGRRPSDDVERDPTVSMVTIDVRFLDVAGAGVIRGRGFTAADGSPGNETVIINARMAAQYFPNEDPIGRRLRFVGFRSESGRGASGRTPPVEPPQPWRTIVGVSPTIWHSSLREPEASSVIYLPLRQQPPTAAYLLLKSALAPAAVMDAVRREVQAIDRDQPVFTVQTLEDLLAERRMPLRVFGLLLAVIATYALVLSSVGLYAVVAYGVSQRTQEIGVRMALGAEGREVTWLVLRRGIAQIAIGLTLGMIGAFLMSRALGRSLVQVTPTDPATFAFVSALLAGVAIAACLFPARRATQIDPLTALRGE